MGEDIVKRKKKIKKKYTTHNNNVMMSGLKKKKEKIFIYHDKIEYAVIQNRIWIHIYQSLFNGIDVDGKQKERNLKITARISLTKIIR